MKARKIYPDETSSKGTFMRPLASEPGQTIINSAIKQAPKLPNTGAALSQKVRGGQFTTTIVIRPTRKTAIAFPIF